MPEILLIISAFLHAVWNSTIKRSVDPIAISLAILASAALANSLFALIFEGRFVPTYLTLFWILGAGFCEGLYFSYLSTAYSRGGFGLAYALMRGGAMCFVWAISTISLDEPFSWFHLLDIIIILFGILLVSSGKENRLSLEAVRFSLLNSLLISGYHICYGQALARGSLPAGTFGFAMLFVALPTFVAVRGYKPTFRIPSLLKTEPKNLFAGGFACGISFFLFLIGLQTRHAGIAISLRNTSVAFGAIIAWMIGECHSRYQWVGIFLIGIGALILPLI